jgi:hypothetical protein
MGYIRLEGVIIWMADKPILTKKYNEEIDLGQRLKEGGVYARMYISVQGNDMGAVKKALDNTIETRLNAEPSITLLEVKLYDILKEKAKTKGEKFFSGVAEAVVVADDFRWFMNMILRYGPSAIEIMEPSEVKLSSDDMHAIVADSADFAHVYSQQIISMLKDPERRRLLDEMMKDQ